MAYDPQFEEPQSHNGTWIATVVLIVGFILGLLIFPPLYEAPKVDASSSVLFVGRFHPILLHLPIGALIFLVVLEFATITKRGELKFGPAALLALFVGSAGSVVAVLAGIMLSREGGYVGGNFSLHQTMGIIGTAGVLLALVVRLTAMGQRNWELLQAYKALFFISFGIMSLGAHFGGNLSHGSTFLVKHAPPFIKEPMVKMEKWMLSFVEKPKPAAPPVIAPEIAPVPKEPTVIDPKIATSGPVPKAPVPPVTPPPSPSMPNPVPTPPIPAPATDDKLVFQHVILPIFEAKCNKCHGEEKQKGELRLDTFEWTMKGGEESGDKNVVPGKPDESVTFQLISSPEDDSEHMPPEGKEQLTAEETALIKWWIEQGASSTLKVSDSRFPAELKAVVDGIVKG
ncbi:MAG TPA: c-type cytochrome domain-containing protein [Prosthecobacter sp.]